MRALRARRAAAIEPVADLAPRDPEDMLGPAVEVTLAALQLGPRDAAVAQLARRFAGAIDEAADPGMALARLGPMFLKILLALGAVPASRPAGKPGSLRPAGPNRVALLRAEHQKTKRPGRG